MYWKPIIFIIFYIICFIKFVNSQTPPKKLSRFSNGTDDCPEMIEWESIYPKECFYVQYPIEYVVVHHTMGLRCFNKKICERIVKNIQIHSMKVMSYPDIKYNFILGEDGNVYQGTGWFRKGFHTSNQIDLKSIGIAFIGDFTDSLPNNEAMENLRKIIKCGKKEGYLSKFYKVLGAFQVDSRTNSPGKLVYNQLKNFENFIDTENETM